MGRMTSTDLLCLMHRNHPGLKVARRLVAGLDGYDWEHRPEPPIDPGCWIGPDDYAYWRAHPPERGRPSPELLAHRGAERRFENYPRDWPAIPAKAVRQALRLGWLERCPDGLLAPTHSGRERWHIARYGYREGSKPPRRSRKRRPKGQRKMFSAYRWHVEGRNRKGSTPLEAPHIRLRRREAYFAALAASEGGQA